MDATQLDLRILSILLKYRCRNLNAYPNVYSSEDIFIFKGDSTVQFIHKPNKQMRYFKQDRYFDVNLVIIAAGLWTKNLRNQRKQTFWKV